eukprot:scaffold66310_cov24-Tisochrysis_lutea.AAC.1
MHTHTHTQTHTTIHTHRRGQLLLGQPASRRHGLRASNPPRGTARVVVDAAGIAASPVTISRRALDTVGRGGTMVRQFEGLACCHADGLGSRARDFAAVPGHARLPAGVPGPVCT